MFIKMNEINSFKKILVSLVVVVVVVLIITPCQLSYLLFFISV